MVRTEGCSVNKRAVLVLAAETECHLLGALCIFHSSRVQDQSTSHSGSQREDLPPSLQTVLLLFPHVGEREKERGVFSLLSLLFGH